MRIVIATPLFPPDIADPAPYVKELARRLEPEHQMTIVTYGRFPEHIPGVTILTIDKQLPLFRRLWRFTATLSKALRDADVVYLQSGASAEVPVLMARTIHPVGLWVRITTPSQGFLRNVVRRTIMRSAREIQANDALIRPEILPLEPYPTDAFARYEAAWKTHLNIVTT